MSVYEKIEELNIDLSPLWGVAFEGGFRDHQGNIGKEIGINHSFSWGDEKWTVAAVYICDEGLVLDYSVEINLDRLNTFLDKWKLTCNGNMLESCSGSSICWIPLSCHADEYIPDTEAKRFVRHN